MPEPYAFKHGKYMSNYLLTGNAKVIGIGRQLPTKRKNGEVFQMELNLSEARVAGKKLFIGVVRDISEKTKAKETIYKLTYNDKNTDLFFKSQLV